MPSLTLKSNKNVYAAMYLYQLHHRDRIKKVKSTKLVLPFRNTCYLSYW